MKCIDLSSGMSFGGIFSSKFVGENEILYYVLILGDTAKNIQKMWT